jgi:F0F1-type ATP synthase membrane subunit c/vacuolar-type H+-ATPase subunit K
MIRNVFVLLVTLLIPATAFAADTATAPMQMESTLQLMLFTSFIVIAVGILSSGFALSISLSAYAAAEPSARQSAFIPAVMPGSQGLYSFAIMFLMIQAMNDGKDVVKICLAGVICGLPCLFSAIGQARTAAACIKSINNGQMTQGQALLATGIPELYALTGLAGAFLVMN